MVSLSEKAKGKQRAIDPPEEDEHGHPTRRNITIRFTDGRPDIILTVEAKDSVRDVKRKVREPDILYVSIILIYTYKIRQRVAGLSKRRLRLIYSGKLLVDSFVLIDWISSLEKKQQRSTASVQDGHKSGGEEDDSEGQSRVTWLHCSIGAEVEDEKEEGDEDASKVKSLAILVVYFTDLDTQNTQIKPLRGFDRLAAAGFSEEDIASFRRTFHSQTSGDYLDEDPLRDDQDCKFLCLSMLGY